MTPAINISPGDILKREMSAHGWSTVYLSTRSKIPVETLKSIEEGSLGITPGVAKGLSRAFGASPEFWLNLEENYRNRSK